MNLDKHLSIRLTKEHLEWLDEKASELGSNPSEIIRQFIEKAMEVDSSIKNIRELIRGAMNENS